jgi:hypothetical protein
MLLSEVFGRSVNDAVAESVSQNKPLIVYIAQSDDTWIHTVMDEALLQSVRHRSVALQLEKGSPECSMFEQVFGAVAVPSVYCCRVNKVLDVIKEDVDKDQFAERLQKVLEDTPPDSALEAHSQQTAQAERPVHQPAPQQQSITGRPTHGESRQPARQDPKTLKEQAAESAAKKYQEEQIRKRRHDIEDRERIRRLLKSDEEERKSRVREAKERRVSKGGDLDMDAEATVRELRDNIRHKKDESRCALSIRLLNGHALQHEFGVTDTLNDVREWLEKNRTDGLEPYCFHRTIPRITFGITDEEKTLEALELTPRSALILKPFSSYVSAYKNSGSSSNGLLGKLFSGISSFWNGSQALPEQENQQSVNGANASEPYRDDIPSAQSSTYASPMQSPGTDIALGLSHPSSLSLNIHANEPQRPRTPQIEQTDSPRSLSRMNSNLNPNIRTFGNAPSDERVTYNGNHLDLEDDKSK